MAIVKIPTDQTGISDADLEEIQLKINNGDLVALKTIQEKWKFKDIESILRFAIAVLVQAEKSRVLIDQKGQPTALSPSDNLLQGESSTSSPE